MINPKILSKAETKIKDWEGCLSIPGIRGLVPRYDFVTVEYLNRSGKRKMETLTGFIARIFQHEFDHLHGTVFLDRLDSTKDVITEKEFHRLFRKRSRSQ